jgi:hypothetical protein
MLDRFQISASVAANNQNYMSQLSPSQLSEDIAPLRHDETTRPGLVGHIHLSVASKAALKAIEAGFDGQTDDETKVITLESTTDEKGWSICVETLRTEVEPGEPDHTIKWSYLLQKDGDKVTVWSQFRQGFVDEEQRGRNYESHFSNREGDDKSFAEVSESL